MLARTPKRRPSLELRRLATMDSDPATHTPDAHDIEREQEETQDEVSWPLLQDTPFPKVERRRPFFRLGVSFFLFGLINDVLYVIILAAASDLVPPSTPKGIVLFCNITPAFVAKVGWPYVLKGRIRYAKRIAGCCAISVFGMLVVAAFDSLQMRLLGMALASLSSGLGELTFLQLSTTYRPLSVGGRAVGYYASGTGAAGLAGAALWWFVRALGVRIGIGLSSILPIAIPLVYVFVLPSALASTSFSEDDDRSSAISTYDPVSTDEEISNIGLVPSPVSAASKFALSATDKWELVQPLLLKYMLPLFCVYLFEYTINQGISPTLLYPVPLPSSQPLLSRIISSLRDYYPLWQLVYQTTVFLSRSSISLGIPSLPSRLLPLPALLQAGILVTLAFESASGIFNFLSEEWIIFCVFLLISAEGVCGGLAYVNVFYHVGQDQAVSDVVESERARQEREFQMGSLGFPVSLGILCASLIAMPTEMQLCKAQVRRGKMFCTEL